MINIYLKNNLKYMTMKYSNNEIGAKGGFPDGCNAAIFNNQLLKQAKENATTKYEYKIKLKKEYKNINFKKLHLSLDTIEDYNLLKSIFENLYTKNKYFTIYDVLDFLNSNSHLLN